VRKETPLGLYKGLGAVVTGIVPKMAIRFTSFEAYKQLLADPNTGVVSGKATFAGKISSLIPLQYIFCSCRLVFRWFPLLIPCFVSK